VPAPRHWRPASTAPVLRAQDLIRELVEDGTVPAAGLVVTQAGLSVFSFAAGRAQGVAGEAPLRAFSTRTKMRVASVSKVATALVAHRLAAAGILKLDEDVASDFTPQLRHPDFPAAPVTLRHLLSHTSGLTDPEVYWRPAPGRTEDLFVTGMWRPAPSGPPGQSFHYANFGFALAAHVIERRTGERFDHLVRRLVFTPLGLTAGFNWSFVPLEDRRAGATLYRREEAGWLVSTDGPENLGGDAPTILKEEGFRLEDYAPGTNGTLFSPQGGLRASIGDIARLVRAAALEPGLADPVWTDDPARTGSDADGGYFSAYSAGLQIHPAEASPLPGQRLIGHHGEAYGLYSGAFHLPERDTGIAFAVTGSAADGASRQPRHPVVVKATAPLWDAAGIVLASL
jgi:CubicO group peptidase (beta-lactamase class C family)